MSVDYEKYNEFIKGVAGPPYQDYDKFIERVAELKSQGVEIEKLLGATCGLASESGEASEIVKHMIFQGKPWNEETETHLKKELGDVIWYVTLACMGLGITIDDLVEMNVEKLKKRYPGGEFSVERSENRAEGDL